MEIKRIKVSGNNTNIKNYNFLCNKCRSIIFNNFLESHKEYNKRRIPYICIYHPYNIDDISNAFGIIESFEDNFTIANVGIVNTELLKNINLDDCILASRLLIKNDKIKDCGCITISIITFDLIFYNNVYKCL